MTGAERHYAGENAAQYHEKKRGIPEAAVGWVARLRAEKLQPHIGPADVVFEFGAGYGWNLMELRCGRKVAYDIAELERPGAGIEWVRELSQLNELRDGFADVVICHHALEHVIHPPETLGIIRRLLKEKGKLLLFVPFEKEGRYRRYDSQEPNHHLYSWNAQTLGNLVSECGYVVESVEVGRFGYDRFAAKMALRWKLGEPGFRFIRGAAHVLFPAAEVRLVAGRG